jgi:hypothetical protein
VTARCSLSWPTVGRISRNFVGCSLANDGDGPNSHFELFDVVSETHYSLPLEFQIMKVISAAVLVLVLAFAIHLALGASSPDRPAGVDAQNWIPVSDKMGFIVTSSHPFPPPNVLLAPPAEGYFMVRTGNSWQRIIINDPIKGPSSSG